MFRNPITFVVVAFLGVASYALLDAVFDTPTKQVQIAWTVVGMAGFLITALNLIDALRDRSALRKSGKNGALKFMADQGIKVEVLRLSKMTSIIAIGVLVMTTSPAISAEQRKALHIPEWTTVGIMFTVMLFWIVVGTVATAILDRQTREHFYKDKR